MWRAKALLWGADLALIPALQWAIKVQPLKLSSNHHAPMASRVVPAMARAVGFWEALENRINQQLGERASGGHTKAWQRARARARLEAAWLARAGHHLSCTNSIMAAV